MKAEISQTLYLDWLTRKQVGQILQLSTRTIDRYIAEQLLDARKIGDHGPIRISATSLESLMS
jgi:DNA-binding transcriptional regulator LsrR (DeoR family)